MRALQVGAAVVVLLGLGLGTVGCQTTLQELVEMHATVLTNTAEYQKATGTEVVGTVILDANTQVGLVEAVQVQNPSRITMTFLSKGKKVEVAD